MSFSVSHKEGKSELSLSDILFTFLKIYTILKNKRYKILIFAVIGVIIGFIYFYVKKVSYLAKCTFVIEENGKFSAGQYGNLASLIGIDVGSGSNDLFQGENIIQLYKSNSMIRNTLSKPYGRDHKILLDRYLTSKEIKSNLNNLNYSSRFMDSLYNTAVAAILKKDFEVKKLDKQSSLISVTFESTDEVFAKDFVNAIVSNVNSFYIKTKTSKSRENIKILQNQADSIRRQLNSGISRSVSSLDANPNPNFAIQALRVPAQKSQIDVQMNSAIYSELVKNLEISKLSLLQEKPLIQIVDAPILPLEAQAPSYIKSIVISLLFFVFFSSFYFIAKSLFLDSIRKVNSLNG